MKYFWFYLEGYTFIWVHQKKGMIYNSLHHKSFEFENSGIIKYVIDQLYNLENLYVIKISELQLQNIKLKNFVSNVIRTSSGGLINESEIKSKPIILPPKLKLLRDFEKPERSAVLGKDIKSYLHEITFYINGECTKKCKFCSQYFKQILYCTKSKERLSVDEIFNFISKSNNENLHTINIVGGNILKFAGLIKIIKYFNNFNFRKNYILHYSNLPQNILLIKSLLSTKNDVSLLVNFPLNRTFYKIARLCLDFKWIFVVV